MARSLRFWQGLRVATIAGAIAVVVMVAILFLPRSDDTGVRMAEPRRGERSVADALNARYDVTITVRGFVQQDGRSGLRLCSGLQGSPPLCVGPMLGLENVDARAFGLERDRREGREVMWADDPVAVLGRVSGGSFTVEQVLS